MDTPLGAKRKKDTAPEVDDFYRLGKELQNRSGSSIGAFLPEDRRFREFFGIGANVALVLWNTLLEYGVIPEGGLIIHMLWALHWMKVYPKQHAGSAAAGGSGGAIDPKTWKKYYWPFVEAIALVEPFVVSLGLCVVHIIYIFITFQLCTCHVSSNSKAFYLLVTILQQHRLFLSLEMRGARIKMTVS